MFRPRNTTEQRTNRLRLRVSPTLLASAYPTLAASATRLHRDERGTISIVSVFAMLLLAMLLTVLVVTLGA